MSITVRDNGYGRLLDRLVPMSRRSRITVGVQSPESSQSYPRGLTVGSVASIQHSTRPFLSSWFDANASTLPGQFASVLRRTLLSNAFGAKQFDKLGRIWVDGVRRQMTVQRSLKLSTIRRKGSSVVLVDSGLLSRSVTAKIAIPTQGGTSERIVK